MRLPNKRGKEKDVPSGDLGEAVFAEAADRPCTTVQHRAAVLSELGRPPVHILCSIGWPSCLSRRPPAHYCAASGGLSLCVSLTFNFWDAMPPRATKMRDGRRQGWRGRKEDEGGAEDARRRAWEPNGVTGPARLARKGRRGRLGRKSSGISNFVLLYL